MPSGIMPNRVLCVYDMSKNEQCIAQFDNLREASQYFKKTINHISCIVSRKTLIERKYLLMWVEIRE